MRWSHLCAFEQLCSGNIRLIQTPPQPVPAESEVEALLTAKVEAFLRALQEQSASAEAKCSRVSP